MSASRISKHDPVHACILEREEEIRRHVGASTGKMARFRDWWHRSRKSNAAENVHRLNIVSAREQELEVEEEDYESAQDEDESEQEEYDDEQSITVKLGHLRIH